MTKHEKEIGYELCNKCDSGVLLKEAGFDVEMYHCKKCDRFMAYKDEFFNPIESELPKVLNKYKNEQTENSIYIGRPSKWGNPFQIGKDGTRDEVIAKYKDWLLKNDNLLSDVRKELKGKNLLCFCAPLPCHGDILVKLSNSNDYDAAEILSK